MKTMFTALVAMAMSFSAWASHQHNAACPVNGPENVKAAPALAGPDARKAMLENASENRKSMNRYTRAMQNMLAGVERQKHLDAIGNLEAENAYNNLMADMLTMVEDAKFADQLEDLNAGRRYDDMMGVIISGIAKK